MSVILARLEKIGARCTHAELLFQLAKRDGLKLSDDELANACRHLELRGDLEVIPTYRISPSVARASKVRQSSARATHTNGVGT